MSFIVGDVQGVKTGEGGMALWPVYELIELSDSWATMQPSFYARSRQDAERLVSLLYQAGETAL